MGHAATLPFHPTHHTSSNLFKTLPWQNGGKTEPSLHGSINRIVNLWRIPFRQKSRASEPPKPTIARSSMQLWDRMISRVNKADEFTIAWVGQ
mmetsp:Transcript_22187/g.51148  ORF Transcript_22187/g.51148 Transcript_22187/m.51148 type:complete len:93 (+) Transcript_22187:176-454(+)